jgi:hypothetical protein
MSARRRAELAAAGDSNPFSTLVNTTPLTRGRFDVTRDVKPARKRPVHTGPTGVTVRLVVDRDRGCCVRCGAAVSGERGVGWSIQHRRSRGNGGTSRPDTNEPQNLILLGGDGTTGCHGWVEHHPIEADTHGWAVPMHGVRSNPLLEPVEHALHGRVFLTADGGHSTERPEVAAALDAVLTPHHETA